MQSTNAAAERGERPHATAVRPPVGTRRTGHMPRRSIVAGLMMLSLVATACSSGQGTPGTSAGAGASAGTGASAATGSSEPGGSPAASGGGAALTGTLQVGAKYGCKPIPCTPSGEGAADEIAVTRYDVFA